MLKQAFLVVVVLMVAVYGCNQDGACWAPSSGLGSGGGPGQGVGGGPVIQPYGGSLGETANDNEDTSGDAQSAPGCPKTGSDPAPSQIVNYLCSGVVKDCASVSKPLEHSQGMCFSASGVGATEYQARLAASEDCEAELDYKFGDGAPWVCYTVSDVVCAPQYRFKVSYSFPCYDAAKDGVTDVCAGKDLVMVAPSCDDAQHIQGFTCVNKFKAIDKWTAPACPMNIAGVSWSCDKLGAN